MSKNITIIRTQRVTYSICVEVTDEEAESLTENQKGGNYTRLCELCPDKDDNWQDSENPEFEVEQSEEP